VKKSLGLSARILALAVLLAALPTAASAIAAGRSDTANNPQQSITCQWTDLGNLNRAAAYAASALDPTAGVMYVYGGYSDPSNNWLTQNDVSAITFGATLTRADTAVAGVPASGAKDREALGGVYRPKGDDSAVYWIGGRDNSGTTSSQVQVYQIQSGTWSVLPTAGTFSTRDEHAAAYDSQHDAIWVAGGEISACTAAPCTAPQMPTSYLAFDAATGAAVWHDGPDGAPRARGGTMVYDSNKKRMLFFGGTIDGDKGTDQLYQLDLSDPDIGKAQWSALSATGTAPQVAVHGAAYDPEHNWMVVYGGMNANYAVAGRESGETRTFALDLAQSPPAWRNLGATMGERIQAVMEYVPKHKAVVLAGGRMGLADPTDQTAFKRSIHALECTTGTGPTPTRPVGPTPTKTPSGGPAPTVAPTPTLESSPYICDEIKANVPAAVINAAVAQPSLAPGYGETCNPNLPASTWNPLRRYLTLENPNRPFHPMFNTVVWECGCG
jgi:hypothetical protein